MIPNSVDELKQSLMLIEKSTQDLALLCEGMGLLSNGSKQELVKRLLALNIPSQSPINLPQLLALRTKFLNKRIPEVLSFLEEIRKSIDLGDNNFRKFSVLNSKGEQYYLNLRYIFSSTNTSCLL